MKLIPLAALVLGAAMPAAHAQDSAADLDLQRLYASPGLSGREPRSVAYAPDGTKVTFLRGRTDDAQRFDLWAFDTATGEARMLVDSTALDPDEGELSEEEKALRERKRIAGSRGIVSYDWDAQGRQVLVPLGGDLYLASLDGQVRRLTGTEGFEYDAKVSPQGGYVSFLRDGALYAVELSSGRERRISPEADLANAVTYGTAEFVAQEEMSRYTGNWWSPDDGRIAYTRTDESTVDVIPRFDIAADEVSVIEQRYPRAGRPNAVVRLFVEPLGRGEPVEVEWGASPDAYLARVDWASPTTLYVQTVNRDQTELKLSRVNAETGEITAVATERQATWINLSNDFRPLPDGGFLWTTEETGKRHVYRWDADGTKTAVTSGPGVVSGIEAVDTEAGEVWFTGFGATPLERHLYKVSYREPGKITQVTPSGGTWDVKVAPNAASYVGTYEDPKTPPQTALYDANAERIAWIEENALEEGHPYFPFLATHAVPEFGTLEAEDGQTLHYSVLKPHDFDPSRQYPVIVEVYGGPHVQTVTKRWPSLADEYLQRQGYVVFRLDNRGSYNRGKAFEDVIFERTGGPEVRDQLRGVEWLKSQDWVDPARIAIEGWSYGGYMTLMTALQAPEGTFAAAVSGAPVTDWALYDTFYTERYMQTPQENPEGYEASSVFPYLSNATFPLLMMHGMADDNVTFDNSTRVYAALQEAGAPFEMMTYPGQRHGIRGEALSRHLMATRMRFLNRHLKPGSEGAD
ncbi:S9 family peptidase [Parvularcula dongshanensis]|uniref:Dipeptidyl-peptidase-4 n=1 Tax=Parvularcula dongshanensis TaxID=1173995 RepID=A0A840I3V4_9PROT|nr:S9 family peptidase [Parvularcula dongshanensis]MBB4659549.1 dipeptidyl-peptidase-4 [Parvularcula dongshanensis]